MYNAPITLQIDREARRRLHHKLIDQDDRPCLWCGSKLSRIIDRIEGHEKDNYAMPIVRVLCEPCHIKRHNRRKFSVGDKVIINGRCPKWLVKQLRHNRLRTITSVYYDSDKACCRYYLGNNKMGASDDLEAYPFRSYMLHHRIVRPVGRPRVKRQYLSTIALCPTKPQPGQENNGGAMVNYLTGKITG